MPSANVGGPGTSLPRAVTRPERRVSWAWLIPVAALLLAGWLGFRAWQDRGVIITVQVPDGHGLRAGDDVRYKGITVGEVRDVAIADDLQGVIITAGLRHDAAHLARAGSRFWIVRPQLRLTNVEGLETLVGPRYLAVLPALRESPPWREFTGLAEPPIVEYIEPGDLEVIVEADEKGTLAPGSPVTYRRIRVGTVLSVGLMSDGGGVEARLHIRRAYAGLVRVRTRFWDAGGVRAEAGLTGFALEIESLEAALRGSVALATPPEPEAGPPVRTGHRFILASKPESDWLRWEPRVAIGSSLLPAGEPQPVPLRARLGWTQGRIFRAEKSRHGWVLQTERGLLGPADLLRPAERADRDTVVLEVAGATVPLAAEPLWTDGVLALVEAQVVPLAWPASRLVRPAAPEDCLVMADPAADPIPLAASRLTAAGNQWRLERGLSLDDNWHGAVVVARATGTVVGVLVVDSDTASVALLPATMNDG